MIRTQVYLDNQLHKDLQLLAKQEHKPMAEVTRDILRDGLSKKKNLDTSGKQTLLKLIEMSVKTNGDDLYVSDNHDHYLYGGSKKRV